ncbi:MAG: restriction endonuclease PLD domain-containing protein [Kiritimatiellia bacterium]
MKAPVVDKDLFEYALIKPRLSTCAPNTLRIVSGYATHAMAARHLIEMTSRKRDLNIDLIYGMAGSEGVSKINHLGFLSLEKHQEFAFDGDFSCSYVKKPRSVHSKVYVWCKGETPVQAFIGSANYSAKGFNLLSRIETLAECDPVTALDFFYETKKMSVPCAKVNRDKDFPVKVRMMPGLAKPADPIVAIEQDKTSPFFGREKIILSLLTRKGDVGNGSHLNWGVRPDGSPRVSINANGSKSVRNPNQSYIGLPAALQRSGFFPDIAQRFTVLTDDNKIFTCVRAQANGKGIETPQDNSEIGRYFRQRLGLSSGAYISIRDLKKYGRCDVTFYKLDDENYVMDFSRPTR